MRDAVARLEPAGVRDERDAIVHDSSPMGTALPLGDTAARVPPDGLRARQPRGGSSRNHPAVTSRRSGRQPFADILQRDDPRGAEGGRSADRGATRCRRPCRGRVRVVPSSTTTTTALGSRVGLAFTRLRPASETQVVALRPFRRLLGAQHAVGPQRGARERAWQCAAATLLGRLPLVRLGHPVADWKVPSRTPVSLLLEPMVEPRERFDVHALPRPRQSVGVSRARRHAQSCCPVRARNASNVAGRCSGTLSQSHPRYTGTSTLSKPR